MRVLVVDTDDTAAAAWTAAVRRLGYEVGGVVGSLDQAAAIGTRAAPTVMLIHASRAGGPHGLDAARRICLRGDAAIVFLASRTDEALLADGRESWPCGFLVEPFHPRDLQGAIDVALAKQAARIDPLTRLPNRRGMDELLAAEWDRCRHAGRPLGLLVIDVDCFKAFNDAVGHPAGDQCLRTVAAALRDACGSPEATVCRWGGEEFVAVLPGADEAAAELVAAALVQAVRDLRLPHRGSAAADVVTVSIGVAASHPATARAAAAVVARADAALYAAKRAGRNRFTTAARPAAD